MESDPSSSSGSGPPDDDRGQLDRMGSLLEAGAIPAFRLETDGTICHLTDALLDLTGYDRDELLGSSFSSLAPDDGPAIESVAAERSSPSTVSCSMRTEAGSSIECDLHVERFERTHGESRLVGIVERRATASGSPDESDLTYGKTFRALADAVPDGIIVLDTDSNIQYANPAVERILGYTPGELVGSSKVRIIPQRLREAHLEALARYLETGERNLNWTYVELPGHHKSGYEVPLGVSLNDFVYDGSRYFVGLFRDITARKETEQALREKVAQLESIASLGRHALEAGTIDDILEQTAKLVDAALDIDRCAVLEYRSDREDRFDLRAAVTDTDGEDDTSAVDTLVAVAAGTVDAAGPIVVEDVLNDARIDDRSGSDDSVQSAAALPIGSPAEPWGILAIGRWETHRVADHDVDFLESVATILATGIERQRYERRLNETLDKYETSNEQLEQFAYAASHDLQEPLRMISSYLQLLERQYADELDEDAEEFIEYAVDGAERMKAMIDGLLEYSRIDTQGDPFEPVDLEAVVDDVLADLTVLIEQHDAEITTESLPTVRGDPRQLRQLFQNLFSNAIQYSGDDPPRIDVCASRANGMWEIAVRDDGIGIDAADPAAVFGMFERLHGHETHDGTGIGLALCRRIVDRHGGTITVDSDPGEGSVFRFTVPPDDVSAS
ncbi:PAS domain S-box protein [Salinadaptatus halalkaliphilus]|uniref:histidine kinase n=1 Tax=Salinadaptatus halalkaliphilus TaxID=2419781 RepID=A0A4S3TP27_9EURY|nr:PAS domain S-box protein [Salinadaptatus halalkaliphilus]THE64338.1 PAS domain S-box protein [Salinadaptatus halalkaliphilus]